MTLWQLDGFDNPALVPDTEEAGEPQSHEVNPESTLAPVPVSSPEDSEQVSLCIFVL